MGWRLFRYYNCFCTALLVAGGCWMLTRRLILIVLISLLLVVLGLLITRHWLKSGDLSETLRKRVSQWVTDETNGQYQLLIGDLRIIPEERNILVSKLELTPAGIKDSSVTRYRFQLENLLIKNVDLATLLESSVLDLSNVTIAGGVFELLQGTNNKKDSLAIPQKSSKKGSAKGIQGLKIDSIQLSKLDLIYKSPKNAVSKFNSVHLDLYGFDTDSLRTSKKIPFPVNSFRLAIKDLQTQVAEKSYTLKADQLIVTGTSHIKAIIKKITLDPTSGASLESLAAKTPEQMDIYQLRINEIVVDSLDYKAFLEDSLIRTPLIVLHQPVLNIFNDRSRPAPTKSKIGKNPHQLIQKLSYGLDVPRLQVKNGSVTYREKNADATATGRLHFGSISGNAGPIQKGVQKRGTLELDLSARLMDKTPMQAHFYFPPQGNGAFRVKGSVQPFMLEQLNPVVKPLARVNIRSGKSRQLNLSINGNDNGATGTISFLYEDLKVDVLKDKDSGRTAKRPLISLLANNFLIRTNNTADDRKDHQFNVKEERDPYKSFFNLIWKTIFQGLKSSAGIKPGDAKPA